MRRCPRCKGLNAPAESLAGIVFPWERISTSPNNKSCHGWRAMVRNSSTFSPSSKSKVNRASTPQLSATALSSNRPATCSSSGGLAALEYSNDQVAVLVRRFAGHVDSMRGFCLGRSVTNPAVQATPARLPTCWVSRAPTESWSWHPRDSCQLAGMKARPGRFDSSRTRPPAAQVSIMAGPNRARRPRVMSARPGHFEIGNGPAPSAGGGKHDERMRIVNLLDKLIDWDGHVIGSQLTVYSLQFQ